MFPISAHTYLFINSTSMIINNIGIILIFYGFINVLTFDFTTVEL